MSLNLQAFASAPYALYICIYLCIYIYIYLNSAGPECMLGHMFRLISMLKSGGQGGCAASIAALSHRRKASLRKELEIAQGG